MAVRLTDTKTGKEKGTTYSDKDVGRMVRRTQRVPGSVLRRNVGAGDVLKLQGRKATRSAKNEVMAAARGGSGGFTAMPGKKRGRGARSGT